MINLAYVGEKAAAPELEKMKASDPDPRTRDLARKLDDFLK